MNTDNRADVSERTIYVHQCPSVVSRSRRPAWPPRPLSTVCILVAFYLEIRTLTQELMREKTMERTMAAPTARVQPMKVPMTQPESWR